MNPVPSYGGNVCCTGNAVQGGAFDQRRMEARPTSWSTRRSRARRAPKSAVRSTPRCTCRRTRRIPTSRSSCRRLPRRHGLQPGRDDPAAALSRRLRQAARVDGVGEGLQGDAAAAEHQQLFRGRPPLRIGVSSSNFPRFDRNLNTGGNNYDETKAWSRTTRCTTRGSTRRRSCDGSAGLRPTLAKLAGCNRVSLYTACI